MTEQAGVGFGGLLRQLRIDAGLTQDELAEAAQVSQRTVSDLERGINRTARKDTAVLLAGALSLDGPVRDLFVAAARGRAEAGQVLTARSDTPASLTAMGTGSRPAAAVSMVPRELLNHLPAQVSSFIGREGELAEARRLVTSWLVTLTGSGGVGKTRLGLQVAAGLVDVFADGVWFTDLAPLRVPDLVPATVAHVLGIRGDPGRPLAGTLIDAVGQRSLLVLLDNCEHVLDACAKLADALLRGCPNIRLLATSREPLGIDGEVIHRVPSMDTPANSDDPDAIGTSEAVRLLTDRAARRGVMLASDQPTAVVVGRICRRLDGIPLALELAAARLPGMSVAELDARLDQRFSLLTGGSRVARPRQRTLRATVNWSWELLTGPERQALARLSVFAGGFDLAAAEALVTGTEIPPDEVLTHLGALVDKSLVQFDDAGTGPDRYRLLETIRQYAARKLEQQNPAAPNNARTTHRNYYLALAETAAPQLGARDQAEWLDRLDAELDNLRAAIGHCLHKRDSAPGIRLAVALREFWRTRGHPAEGIDALRALLKLPTPAEQPLLRARGLTAAAYLLEQTGGYATAKEYCDEGLAIARAAGDDELTADLLHLSAMVLLRRGQPGRALPLIESGLGLARRHNEPHLTARLLGARSFALDLQGDHAAAARDDRESLQLYRQAGDRRHVGTTLGNLGYAELSLGDLDAARAHLAGSLDTARALGDHYGVVYETLNLGLAEYLSGSLTAAEDLFTESLNLAARMGTRAGIGYALMGLAMTSDGPEGMSRSARLHGAAGETLATLGETIEPLERVLRDRDCERLRSAMGAAAFEAEYAAGRALTSKEILILALGGFPAQSDLDANPPTPAGGHPGVSASHPAAGTPAGRANT